jgi:hypothetical protein
MWKENDLPHPFDGILNWQQSTVVPQKYMEPVIIQQSHY